MRDSDGRVAEHHSGVSVLSASHQNVYFFQRELTADLNKGRQAGHGAERIDSG